MKGEIAESSNGRTTVSGTVYLGSSPGSAANKVILKYMSDLQELKIIQKSIKETDTWTGVFKELTKKGIDASKILVADNFAEDVCQEYWAVVTFDKHIYEFYYDWLDKKPSEGVIIEWHDFTKEPSNVYMRESVEEIIKHFEALTT